MTHTSPFTPDLVFNMVSIFPYVINVHVSGHADRLWLYGSSTLRQVAVVIVASNTSQFLF